MKPTLNQSSLRPLVAFLLWGALVCLPLAWAEIPEIDPTSEGPWSDVERTTLNVPLVPNDRIQMDGSVSQGEYGNFPGQLVDPGTNAWILDFPGDRQWDDANDSSFTFFLAHDETYFYVGVQTKDDVLNQDDNDALWKDDSVEIIVDALNDRYDVNTDASNDAYGGHNYVSYNGLFSDWDHEADARLNMRWSSAVEWTYGEDGEIWAVGGQTDGEWHLDIRFAKSIFEDPEVGNKLNDNYVMGFNIGMDDDDKFGPGANGDASREQDLELQYWWANRMRLLDWNAETAADYTPEQIANGEHEKDFEMGINSGGRLTHGGTGEILFSPINIYEEPGPKIDVNDRNLGQLSTENQSHDAVITVWNRGIENALTLTGVNVGGANAALFTVNQDFPLTLEPQSSVDIPFTFAPDCETGGFSASLEFQSDDSDPARQNLTVALSAGVVNLQGPIAHYTLDEAAGATEMLDVTGFGRHGTFEAGAGSLDLGQDPLAAGTAMQVSGGGVAQVDGRQLSFESFTVSTWFNTDGGDNPQTLFAQGELNGSPTYALLAAGGNLTWFVGEAPVFGTEDGSAYTVGTTHHVAVSYGHAAPNKVSIYVDGVEVASQEGLDPLLVDRDSVFLVGSFGPLTFAGRIDDVQVYDRELSPADVTWLRDNPGKVIGEIDPEACGGDGGGTLLVDLDATGLAPGAVSEWSNAGDLGGVFLATGDPTVEAVKGVNGITLDGDDTLQGPNATAALEGNGNPRSVEAWIYNPAPLVAEEAIIAWGHRGGPDGANFGFHSGNHPDFGAVGHWGAADLGWNEAHVGDSWQYLVSTLDANQQHKVYVDGELVNEEDLSGFDLVTHPGQPITVGAENAEAGGAVKAVFASLTVGKVRVHAATLSGEQIASTYASEKAAFADPDDVDGDRLSDALERELFGDLSQGPDDDFDGDGLSNADEIRSGSDPTMAEAVTVLVELDASSLAEGPIASWPNAGGLGGEFQAFGDPLVEVIEGVVGVSLDGDGDYFEGPASTPAIEGASARSIIAWVYNPELQSEETVISWGKRGGPDGTNLAFNHGFHNVFGAVGHWGSPDIGWNPNTDVEEEDPGALGDAKQGEWTHLVYTQTGSLTRVYTNGQLTNSESVNINTHPGLGILIGAQREGDGVAVTEPLKGSLSIANVRVYDGVIADADILADFQAGIPTGEGSGLEGYWAFDEGAGTTAADGSGTGRDASFRNGAPGWTDGKWGAGLAFDGDDDLTVVGWKGISGAGARTVSYWLKTDWVVDASSGTVAWGTSATGQKWHLRLNNSANNGPVGAVRTEIEGSFHIGTKVINDNDWHHIVSIFPDGGQFMQDLVHYVDGELQEVGGTGSTTVEVNTAGEAEGGTDVTFGSRLQGVNDQFFFGNLDDISIWSRALSVEEVTALHAGVAPPRVAQGDLGGDDSGLLGYWKFDGDTTDASGNGHDGALTNGAALADDIPPGSSGQSLQISGGEQHVLVPHSDGLNITEAMTITAWVKPVGDMAWDGVIAKNPSDGSNPNHAGNYELRIENGTRGIHFLYQNGGDNDTVFHLSEAAVITGDTWSHVAVTAEKGGVVHYYINGQLVDTHADPVRDTFGAPNSNPLYIGSRADLFTAMDGFLDDVALFDRVLSADEIGAVMEWNRTGGGDDPRTGLGAVAISEGPLTAPAFVDFGELSGDATYEFSFNALKDGASTAITGNDAWAIKLDQWNEQGLFGTTQFGVADNVFTAVDGQSAASVFGTDVHVVVVNDTAGGETRLYANGVHVGTWAGNFELAGEVNLMAARIAAPVDAMGAGSVMYGWATYNSALAADAIATLVSAPFPAGMPPTEPFVLGNVGINAGGAFNVTIPDGVTADIEYSTDLINWEVIATGLTGTVEETDAARLAAPSGYYRAK